MNKLGVCLSTHLLDNVEMVINANEHKDIRNENNKANVTENVSNQNDEDIEKTDEEKSFDLYVKVNFLDILEKYLENQKSIHCYYCDFSSESKILRNIEDEIYLHLRTKHKEVINAFEIEEIEFKNTWHEEFLGFFGSD